MTKSHHSLRFVPVLHFKCMLNWNLIIHSWTVIIQSVCSWGMARRCPHVHLDTSFMSFYKDMPFFSRLPLLRRDSVFLFVCLFACFVLVWFFFFFFSEECFQSSEYSWISDLSGYRQLPCVTSPGVPLCKFTYGLNARLRQIFIIL